MLRLNLEYLVVLLNQNYVLANLKIFLPLKVTNDSSFDKHCNSFQLLISHPLYRVFQVVFHKNLLDKSPKSAKQVLKIQINQGVDRKM